MQLKTTCSLALAFALAFGSGAVFAQDMSKTGKPLTAQQEKMKGCNAEAKTKALAGADRKAFMKTCLSGSSAAAAAPAAKPAAAEKPATAKTTQQEKMKACSTDAKEKKLKGADRKTFMSTCLKGEGAAAH
ncbi:PsiF family protein [Dokdonella soli]|uniref:Phosphate starvation-inducible protein PsiF n=1 Tax=Dokdonella soli TaxID=529810 RepID=A0ABN1ITN0_9GAMM